MDNNRLLRKRYWPACLQILNGERDTEMFDLLRTLYMEFGLDIPRGPYCQFGGNTHVIQGILDGDIDTTTKNIRIGPSTFRRIVTLIPGKRSGWAVEIDLICFLYWLAETCSYRTISNLFDLPRSTVETIIHRMLDIILGLRNVISNSALRDNYDEIGRQFCRRGKTDIFRNCIGAIDGTHIRIKCPVNRHQEYFNYKYFYSIQAQTVATSQYLFSDVFVGYPGSVHDSRVLRNSAIYIEGRHTPEDYFILGDGGNFILNKYI